MRIEGLVAATFSTFHEDGSVNTSLIPDLVDKLIAEGVKGIFICGTNGEGPNLTIEERMQIAEEYVRAINKRILLLVHVGHSTIAEARKLAAHAEQIGADAISSVSAFYFKPTSVETMVACMAEIAAAAPSLPFYYYHIPALTGVAVDALDFLTLGEQKIPTLAGIKYTAATLHEYQACLNYKNGKFDILFGYDELLLPALSVGARGAIGSTYTFAAPIYLEVVEHFRKGRIEAAQEAQYKAVKMIQCLGKYSPIPTQKAILKLMGTDLGPCRLPLNTLSAAQVSDLRSMLEEKGFFETMETFAAHEAILPANGVLK
ncbi:MAG: dihydrodipicolinate synthase family protein [Bacteroidota bacterium]|nr:dihydrodipicolinate synthase family protein [Bacteroidota bacterium]